MFKQTSRQVTDGRALKVTRSRLRNLRAPIGAVALIVGVSGCGVAPSDGTEGDRDEAEAAQVEAKLGSDTLTNSSPRLDQKYLAGMGYLDGTTCDIWPRDLDFHGPDDNVGAIAGVLSRYSIPSSVAKLRAMTNRLRDLHVKGATAIGSKNELVVTLGNLGSERVLVAIDESTRQGFLIDDEWLCTEQMQRKNPLSCKESSVKVGKVKYSVLGRTEKAGPASSILSGSDGVPMFPPATVVLVAPQIRFAPPTPGGELISSSYLIAIGQRVYGGSPYVAGEDLSKRTTDSAKVTVSPSVAPLPELPDRTTWRRALFERRTPGFVAVLGEETGGISALKAEAPAAVQSVWIGEFYAEDAHYDPTYRALYVRPAAYFEPVTSACEPTRVPGKNGVVSCTYRISVTNNPRIRPPGGGGAAFLLSGSTGSKASLSADEPYAMPVVYSLDEIRNFLKGLVRPLLDNPSTPYWVYLTQGANTLGSFNGEAWATNGAAYRTSALNEAQGNIAAALDAAFPPTVPVFGGLTGLDAATDSAVRQVSMGGMLFSRGAFADVLFGRSELESLRSGEVSSSWTDTWRLMSDYNLGSKRISGYDPEADYGIDPDRRRRAEQMATYVDIAPSLKNKSNVLGLAYGQSAAGWFTSSADGVPSIYAAEKRWSQIGSLVSQFQSAADASAQLANAAQRDAMLKVLNALNEGLKRDITNTANAADTVAAAARANASTQQASLDEFKKGYDKLVDLSHQLQTQMNDVWNCPPELSPDQCVAAANAKMKSLESECNPSTGFEWLEPFVKLASTYIPAIAVTNAVLETYAGKDLVGTMTSLIEDPQSAGGMISHAVDKFVPMTEFAKEFEGIDKQIGMAALFSKGMHDILDAAPRTCKVKGQPQTNMDNFRGEVVLVDNLTQNYAIQLSLVHGMMNAQLGHIGYLGTEGDTYEKTAASQRQSLADLNAVTKPLLSKLNAMTDFKYSDVADEMRSFMTNACRSAVKATRASQADLHMVSQALQTSTGAAVTQPYLVLPANAAWHFDSGTPAGLSQEDKYYGFGMSLWDRSAFDSRFSPSGSGTTDTYLSQAGARFAQLMNGEVCKDAGPKPATGFVVRKVFTGQALKTLVSSGKLDFNVGLDDIVASGKDGSNATKGVIAQNLSTGTFDLKLDGAFVISAGFSVCNGAPGKECSSRVAGNNLGSVAGGALNALFVANHGRGYVPNALARAGAARSLVCADGQERFESTKKLRLGSVDESVSSCLTPVLTPRTYASATYFDNAGAPDSQVLSNHVDVCAVDAQTLAGRPLQGLPVLGTWALATSGVAATALTNGMTAAPISNAALPAPDKATAVEVLFIVGAEPVDPASSGGYTLNP